MIDNASQEANSFIRALIEKDPLMRLSAKEA